MITGAAVNEPQFETRRLAQHLGIPVNLYGQLTGRRQNYGTRIHPVVRFGFGMREQVIEDGEQESCSLAGAGLGLARNVFAGESQRQGLRLNFGAVIKSSVAEPGQQLGFQ